MKRIVLLTVIIMGISVNFSKAQENFAGKKVLIAYYSWGGNTEAIANNIQKLTGGDIFKVEPVTPYPTVYNDCTKKAKEDIEAGYKPELKEKVSNIESYDIIFVGTPNWWSTIAPPIATFLTEHNLSGKTVIPFVTHGGGGKARCFSDMEKLASQATFLDGFIISGNSAKSAEKDVDKWLNGLSIK
ncbi:MAG: NAD(P)H-dependent oxidoreductase [Odoribacter sp.]|nr:NAD(P)H-dependent oxidoreductase [Odoribacter sp.]